MKTGDTVKHKDGRVGRVEDINALNMAVVRWEDGTRTLERADALEVVVLTMIGDSISNGAA